MPELNVFLHSLVEQFPGVAYVLEVDDDGHPLGPAYVSPQSHEIMGVPPAAWSDCEAWLEHVHEDDRAGLISAYAEMSATGMPQTCEFRWTRPGGNETWLSDTGSLVCYATGARYLQGLILDISEAKRAQDEHLRMERELRLSQKLEAVGQLAAGIAHEINTPVQFVGDSIGFVREAFDDLMNLTDVQHRLLQAPELPAEHRAEADRACEAADLGYLRERAPAAFGRAAEGIDRVSTIVKAMRHFAHTPGDHVPVDVNEGLRSTLVVATNEYRFVADVETDLQDLPLVRCNAGDLNQVFLNLIVNAAHAIADHEGDAGGRGTIRVSSAVDGDHALISVADTGGGIPADVAERIFDPFFTTKEVGRGTGQGLAIARTLVVERHGGTLTFEPAPGGTSFQVRIPLAGVAPGVGVVR